MKKIINIGIIAHVDAGKTTLTEQILYYTKATRNYGSVDNGNTNTDFLSVEKKRGISVRSSMVYFNYKDLLVNLIDTPGHIDFCSEVERAFFALDCAILLISANEGIKGQTKRLFNALQELKIPTIICINKVDLAGCDIQDITEKIKKTLTNDVVMLTNTKNEGEKSLVIDYLLESELPSHFCEAVADYDDDIAQKYLSDAIINNNEYILSLKHLCTANKIYPIVTASASLGIGIDALVKSIHDLFVDLNEDNLNDSIERNEELSGIIYKITHNKAHGKACHVRLFSGTIKPKDVINLYGKEDSFKVTQVKKVFGSSLSDVPNINKNDIGAVFGITAGRAFDIIGKPHKSMDNFNFTKPLFTLEVVPQDINKLMDLVSALQELSDEDPLLDMVWVSQIKQLHIKITGMMQLDILEALLNERYDLKVTFNKPLVIYKETPSKFGYGMESYTMPKPCWAVIKFNIQPAARNSGLIYTSNVSDNDCRLCYQEHIKNALPSALKQGVFGYEVVDLKVHLEYAQSHNMHTHPLDFFLATPLAIMNGLMNVGTDILEPILSIRIQGDEDILGRVISDITKMRGEFDTPIIKNSEFIIDALVPVSESMNYFTDLAILSSGKASMTSNFSHYKKIDDKLKETIPILPYNGAVSPKDRAKWILHKRGGV